MLRKTNENGLNHKTDFESFMIVLDHPKHIDRKKWKFWLSSSFDIAWKLGVLYLYAHTPSTHHYLDMDRDQTQQYNGDKFSPWAPPIL